MPQQLTDVSKRVCQKDTSDMHNIQWRNVYKYLQDLIHDIPSTDNSEFCSSIREEHTFIENNVLIAFGQCANIPIFNFNLTHHTPEQWLCLYAGAIRCSLERNNCNGGFVFLSWNGYKQWNRNAVGGHATVLHFDIEKKTQTFFDPSTAINNYGESLFKFMETHHLWEDPRDKPVLHAVRFEPGIHFAMQMCQKGPWIKHMQIHNISTLQDIFGPDACVNHRHRHTKPTSSVCGRRRLLHHGIFVGGVCLLAIRNP